MALKSNNKATCINMHFQSLQPLLLAPSRHGSRVY
jgi:hypothetical protein